MLCSGRRGTGQKDSLSVMTAARLTQKLAEVYVSNQSLLEHAEVHVEDHFLCKEGLFGEQTRSRCVE